MYTRLIRSIFIFGFQILAVIFSMTTAFLLRFEFSIPADGIKYLTSSIPLVVAAKILAFRIFRWQEISWRYVSTAELTRLAVGNVAGSLLATACIMAFLGAGFPRSIYVVDFLVCFAVTTGAQYGIRLYNRVTRIEQRMREGSKQIVIYGAGAAGINLLREVQVNRAINCQVAGFLDDSPMKRGLSVSGVQVLGTGRDLPLIADRLRRKDQPLDEVVIAMPSANGKAMMEALAHCRAARLPCKTMPGVNELLNGTVLVNQIREVRVEDLLGRNPVKLDESRIREKMEGRCVMVTGGAGSIGSELCRQIASFRPSRIVVFERAESDLFALLNEFAAKAPSVEITPAIGDIRDIDRIEEVVKLYGAEAVFHAAAYKHVPMMENHFLEAVKNNVIGTYNVVKVAYGCGLSDFLMISSDKAVNPTNIMGLTKRAAEIIVSAMPTPLEGSSTNCVSVRFGNVLGSNGSVVPMFKAQIAAGGPVTVTHPEMRRYFMTIPEAVQLVMQASTMGKGSEIFVLDMGEPVAIVDLANRLIELSGHQPGVDIEIRYTGLRPGEKLFEELFTDDEHTLHTFHEKVRIFQGQRSDQSRIEHWISAVQNAVSKQDQQAALELLRQLVPEYRPFKPMAVEDRAELRATAANY